MSPRDGRPVFSPTDLVDFADCAHLAALNTRVRAHELAPPPISEEERLVFERGTAHERAYVARLVAEGKRVVEVRRPASHDEIARAVTETHEAMRAGADVVHGATFFDGELLGIADVALRVERPSAFGAWSYEIGDAKLAREAKPSLILQLCAYSELLAALQAVDPISMHGILGDGRSEAFAYAEFAAYYREIKARYLRERRAATYPQPVKRCGSCRWQEACVQQRIADDHLSQVASIRSGQITKLERSGIRTLADLATAGDDARPKSIAAKTFTNLRAQAALQHAARDGEHRYELLPPAPRAGFALLPPPAEGDLYFDMEGNPFFEGGLEYCFGFAYDDAGTIRFDAFWGDDRAGERRAFENFVDFAVVRLDAHPGAHIYHYAAYEVTALKRLAALHGTRELEVDALLKRRAFVDLYTVVRGALRISYPSYSIKKVERFYRGAREGEVKDALGSIVQYERYRATGNPALKAQILDYNRDDCESTLELHRWLTGLAKDVVIPEPPASDAREIDEKKAAEEREREAFRAEVADREPLLAELLAYHQREARSGWWEYFQALESPDDALIDSDNAIGGLELDSLVPLWREKKSTVFTLTFPDQRFSLKTGDKPIDATTGKGAGTIVGIDRERRRLELSRSISRDAEPLPTSLIGGKPFDVTAQRDALVRLATAWASDVASYSASRDLLERRPVRYAASLPPNASVAERIRALDASTLVIQGPPGSGKTTTAARATVDLIRSGLRVGVTAKAHKAIHTLLERVEAVAHAENVVFRGLYKTTKDDSSIYDSPHEMIENVDKSNAFPPGRDVKIIGGTAWLFARAELAQTLDVLIVDEAGQVALADAIAVSLAARSLVLIGDPMQLPQVQRGAHPPGSGVSVLEHVLGDANTIDDAHGIFLGVTYRLQPAICAFVSELLYDGRLHPAEAMPHAHLAGPISGDGLRFVPVLHDHRSRESEEEAQRIVEIVGDLLASERVSAGERRALTASDVIVVAPYNAQVRLISAHLAAAGYGDVRVGTVDRFQGQEAEVVLFSMTTSNAQELPRDVEFLFSRNRLNVAVSRAKVMAIVLASPDLLRVVPRDVEEMRLLSALCRFVELASPLDPVALPLLRVAQ